MTLYSVFDIANFFLHEAEKDGEMLSNLKLQKLVYYAQGLHLALFGEPIFKEKVIAWNYGPVVPELYGAYKEHGSGGISCNNNFDPKSIDKKIRDFLKEVYTAFGQFSAVRLMELTHTDQCWKEAHPNKTITHKSMQNDLKKYLKNG